MAENVKKQKGALMVEILIATTIITVALLALFGIASIIIKQHSGADKTNQAIGLAQEALEATRSFRDGTNWSAGGLGSLTMGVDYHPQITGTPPQWQLVLGEETVGIFKRKIVFYKAMRDAGGMFVEPGGIEDVNARKVKAIISWEQKNIEIVSYFTNWR